MGRTRLDDIRRAELVVAAQATIAEQGLDRATVACIARRLEISPGIVHHYYADKQALLDATMRDLRLPVADRYHELVRSGTPRLAAAVEAHLDPQILTAARAVAWLAFASRAPYVPSFARILAAVRCRQEAALRQGLLEQGAALFEDAASTARKLAIGLDALWYVQATREGGLSEGEGLDFLSEYLPV